MSSVSKTLPAPVGAPPAGNVATGAATTPAPNGRNLTIDGLKYLAACALVLHHVSACTGTTLGTFFVAAMVWALIFFFTTAGYFHGATGTRGLQWLKRRLGRLAVPYITFSIVYLLIAQPSVLRGASSALPNLIDLTFFAGANGILWSLPMLFYCAVLAELLAANATARRITLAVCVLIVLSLDWSSRLQAFTVGPLQNFWYLPRWFAAYVGGMELRAWAPRTPPPLLVRTLVPLSIVASGLVYVNAGRVPQGYPEVTMTTLWAITVFVLLWGAITGSSWLGVRRLAWGGDFLIGIYVTHIIWLNVFRRFVPADSLSDALWIPAAWAFTLGAATLFVFLMRSNRFTRRFVA